MKTSEIATLLSRWKSALLRHDMSALAALYAEDCRLDSPVAGKVVGRSAVEGATGRFFSAFPEVSLEFDSPLIAQNKAVQTVTFRGTDTSGLFGQAPTGRPFRVFLVSFLEFDNGQILTEQRVYDLKGLLLQLAGDSVVGEDLEESYRAALDRPRLQQELRTAATIQRALLPNGRAEGQGFEVAATSVPCRSIGGDFFDYFRLPNGAFAFVLGDVAGKGLPAALLAAQLQGFFAAESRAGATPTDIVTNVNHLLMRHAIEARFSTIVYAVLSDNGLLTYCNAGHNPPLLFCGDSVRRLTTGGPIIGAFESARYHEESLQLTPDDVLVVYSDGLTEAVDVNNIEFGEERLTGCLGGCREASASASLEQLFALVGEFSAGMAPNDDRTAIVLRYSGT